jgi:hypothetical protein
MPTLVGRLLFGGELGAVGTSMARVTGIALLALGVACWRGSALAGILTYSGLVALYLFWLGVSGTTTGVLLWPGVAVHVVLTTLLAWPLLQREAQ